MSSLVSKEQWEHYWTKDAAPSAFDPRYVPMFDAQLREHLPFLIPFLLADAVSGFLFAIGMEVTLSVLGLSDLGSPTIGTMIYWAGYYQALLARRFWWLAAPIVTSVLLVVGMYLVSISLGSYLDPRTRLKNLAARDAS